MEKVSVIIEWENVLLAEMDRCRAMLAELRGQILGLNSQIATPIRFEIRVAFDRNIVQPEFVEGELAGVFQTADPDIELCLTPATGLNYYDLKNFGARDADGDIILFLDSDVIPQAGWLKNLLDAFNDPAVAVVCGNTFVDSSDLLGRTLALAWFFPRREQSAVLKETDYFFANNVAFRRQVAPRFVFPKMPEGATRGSCLQLAADLKRNGIKLYQHTGAQVNHPPPNGMIRLIVRGIAQGQDELLLRRTFAGPSRFGAEMWRELRHFFSSVRRGFISIARQRKTVNLSPAQTPFAFAIVLVYYQCYFFGALATQCLPRFMASHFRI